MKKYVRLIGCTLGRPLLSGINTKLVPLHNLGMNPKVKLVMYKAQKGCNMLSKHFCSSARKISSPPAALYGLKAEIAHFTRFAVKILPAGLFSILQSDFAVSSGVGLSTLIEYLE